MKSRLLMMLCVCGIAHAESLPPVIDNSMYPAEENATIAPKAPSVPTNPVYELTVRMEQLQEEVQQLTGKVEEQANLIAEMKKSQGTMYSDFNERMQRLEKKSEAVKLAVEGVQAQETPAGTENKPAQPSVDATTAAPEVKPSAPESKPVAADAASPAPAGDEKQQYQQAYDALRNGHNAQAIAEFNALLSRNPKGAYANNAQYWLGEAYRANKDNESARKAFNSVIENFPSSSKVPDSLLKLGVIEAEQKNVAKAREYLTRVVTEFPSSSASRLAAKRLLLLDDANKQ
ncbi:MAG: tol-pal system protein YbgF [Methylobacter sp.]